MNFRLATIEDVPGIVKVKVDTWRTTYQSIISAEFLRNLSYKENEIKVRQRFEDPGLRRFFYVAENDSNEIIGFSLGKLEQSNLSLNMPGIRNYISEFMAIYVLKEHQRKHIGLKLTKLVVEHFFESNVKSMIVWVLKGNPNYRFYEILGGKNLGQGMIEIGANNYIKIAYGWKDIAKILEI